MRLGALPIIRACFCFLIIRDEEFEFGLNCKRRKMPSLYKDVSDKKRESDKHGFSTCFKCLKVLNLMENCD